MSLSLLAQGLDAARFSLCVVAGQVEDDEGDATTWIERSGIRMYRLRQLRRKINVVSDLQAFGCLLRLLWHERPTIIHTHMAKAGALGRVAGWMYNLMSRIDPGRPRAVLIHTFHGHVLEGYFSRRTSATFRIIEQWLARGTDRLVAVNETVRRELLLRGIGRPEQWTVIPLGVDVSSLTDLAFAEEPSPARCGMVGRLVPVKNPGMFLRALERVIRMVPGVAVTGLVVGDGPLRPLLEQECHRLGLGACVQFTGWQQDLRAVYGALDITCLTSWNEGTPVALIEAMAAGRLVVATDVGGVRELLGAEPNGGASPRAGAFHIAPRGLLVQAGDVEGLAAALTCATIDVDLRHRLGQEARAHVVREFGAGRFVRDVASMYEHFTSEGG